MLTFIRKMIQSVSNENIASFLTYEEAVKTLNTLQTNGFLLHKKKALNPQKPIGLEDTEKFLIRSGLSLRQLDTLSVIHVSGTKGKGSTCAFVEAILRNHGIRTGFYSSPHLVSVRERIRINAQPISEGKFSYYFWQIYNALNQMKTNFNDLPTYFKFLTILMFHVFIKENVDVAIIEVGIGGELDCTNIVRSSVCTGVTSLGLDHTNVLGKDLESIAFQKSGIFRAGVPAFTVPQPEKAMSVLFDRAYQKRCSLIVVPKIDSYSWKKSVPVLGIRSSVQNDNASLAIQLASSWMLRHKTCINKLSNISECTTNEITDDVMNHNDYIIPNDKESSNGTNLCLTKVAMALESCRWPGRTQFLPGDSIDFYIDGAHTIESIESCMSWFSDCIKETGEKRTKFLIFNATGVRDSMVLLNRLKQLEFKRAFFVPNVSGLADIADNANFSSNVEKQLERCREHVRIWGENALAANTVNDVLNIINNEMNSSRSEDKPQVLITGSLHLVGTVLSIVDPDLSLSTKH